MLCVILALAGCAGNPKTLFPLETPPYESVILPLPVTVPNNFFYQIPPVVLKNIQRGSPSSLMQAVMQLRKVSGKYTESEKILLSVCSGIMGLAYPTENLGIKVPEVTTPNPYTGAIMSVYSGIYDSSTGNFDFLTLTLPSLILLTSSTRTSYYDQAEDALLKALEMEKESVLVNYLLGILYRKRGDTNRALVYLTAAHRLDQETRETSIALAVLYAQTRDGGAAETIALKMLETSPNYPDALELCADIYHERGDVQRTTEFVDRILHILPGSGKYTLLRAQLSLDAGDYIRTVSLLDNYTRHNSGSRDYLLLRATVQRDWFKDNAAAIALMEQALALYPEDEKVILQAAQFAAGITAAVTNDEIPGTIRGKSAGNFAEQVLGMNPHSFPALAIAADEAFAHRDWQGAYDYTGRVIDLEVATPRILEIHVSACLELGRIDEARALAEDFYRAQPAADEAIRSYLRLLTVTTRREEAMRVIQEALPDARAGRKSFLYLQMSLLETRDGEKIECLRKSLTANPRNTDTLLEFYRYYFAHSDLRKANFYLKQIISIVPKDEYIQRLNSELEQMMR
jgi:tetratricopeptide (TPR) repeat protein